MFLKANLLPSFLQAHYDALFTQLDAIQDGPNPTTTTRAYNLHFLIPLLVDLATLSLGIYGLEYDAFGVINFTHLKHSPNTVFHQTFPPTIWRASDGLVAVTVPVELLIYIVMIFTRYASSEYQIHLNVAKKLTINSKPIDAELSQKLLRFRKASQLFMHLAFATGFLIAFIYLYLMMLWVNAAYWLSVLSVIFWALIFPLFIFYQIYGYFVPAIYIIIYSCYLLLMQQNQLKHFTKLQIDLQTERCPTIKLTQKWFHYLKLNTHVLEICRLTTEYSRIWVAYLSILLPGYIVSIGYLVIVLNTGSLQFIESFLFILCGTQLLIFLYLFTHQCSRVVWYNEQIIFANRRLCEPFERQYRRQLHYMPAQFLLKLETFADFRRFTCYSFRLLDNYRITGNTFYLIISYISMFFMLTSKKV